MKIITPQFWHKKNSIKNFILAFVLMPLSLFYYVIFKIVKFLKNCNCGEKIKLDKAKIICLGNITMGGAGKTPSCIFLAKLLLNKGYKVAFLTRGYGRTSKGFFCVESVNTQLYGDEPILLSQTAPTFVYSKANEILKLNDQNFDFIIMDDGLQNAKIYKNFTILVHDFDYNNGNGFLFPSGPLRCLKSDIKYDLIFNITHKNLPTNFVNNNINFYLHAKISGHEKYICNTNTKFYAFAGIARCEKFFTSLTNCNIKLADTIAFADHYLYTDANIVNINNKFVGEDVIIFTTQKDFVKIKTLALTNASIDIGRIKAVDINFDFCNQSDLNKLLQILGN